MGHLEAKDRVLENVDEKPGLAGKCVSGGRLNVFRALVVPVLVEIEPEVLNLGSNGGWITAYVEFPGGIDLADVAPETVVLNGVVAAEASRSRLGDGNHNGVPDWTFQFDRGDVGGVLPEGQGVPVTVEGEIRDTAWFRGTDQIRVFQPPLVGPAGGDRFQTNGAGVGVEAFTPVRYGIHPASPNPFRGATRIGFDLPEASGVRLQVLDARGRLVRTLVNGTYPAGRHQGIWDGRDEDGEDASAGVYFCRLEAGGRTATVRAVLVPK
jgi:hypothetical protein